MKLIITATIQHVYDGVHDDIPADAIKQKVRTELESRPAPPYATETVLDVQARYEAGVLDLLDSDDDGLEREEARWEAEERATGISFYGEDLR